MPSSEDLLAAAKRAAAHGDKRAARQLLDQVLVHEPESEEAWLGIAGVVSDLQAKRRALEQVLLINPLSRRAMDGMEWVQKQELRMPIGGSSLPTDPHRPITGPLAFWMLDTFGAGEVGAESAEPILPASRPIPRRPQTKPLPSMTNRPPSGPLPSGERKIDTGPLPPWLADIMSEPSAPTYNSAPPAAPSRTTPNVYTAPAYIEPPESAVTLAPPQPEQPYRRRNTAPLREIQEQRAAGTVTEMPGPLSHGPLPARRNTAPLDESWLAQVPGEWAAPLDGDQSTEHSPASRSGLIEVPHYPNAGMRYMLLALERLAGVGDVQAILYGAGLGAMVDNYPPADLEPGIAYSDYSAFGRALERYYGSRAKEVQLRLGEETVLSSQATSGAAAVAAGARRMVPGNLMLRRTLESLARDAGDLGVPSDWGEQNDSYLYVVAVCPYCYGRRTSVGCNTFAGVLRATLRTTTGKNYHIEEVTCRGRGDDTCSYAINKIPLD